jgi:hypothetical protein
MATAGTVPGDPDHVLIGVVPDDPDPDPKLAVWLGRDAATEITLDAARRLAYTLTEAVKMATGEIEPRYVATVPELHIPGGLSGLPLQITYTDEGHRQQSWRQVGWWNMKTYAVDGMDTDHSADGPWVGLWLLAIDARPQPSVR